MESGGVSSGAFEARAAGRLTLWFLLDIASLGGMEGRMLDALLMAAIMQANTNPLIRDPRLQLAYARLDAPPPDDLRRPVSVNALAASLRLSVETVRRHVRRLVAEGLCATTPQGLYVPALIIASPPLIATAKARYSRVFQFYNDLRAVKVVEPLPYVPAPAEDPEAPVRAVTRILSDWFFRTIDTLHKPEMSDPLKDLILLEIARSSSEHWSVAEVDEVLRAGETSNAHRRSVRVAHVARKLNAPYETARRHVNGLVEQGFCERVGSGVRPTDHYLSWSALCNAKHDNLVNVRRMFRQLASLDGARHVAAELAGDR